MQDENESVVVWSGTASLPEHPDQSRRTQLAAMCQAVYEHRDEIVGVYTLDQSYEALRRVSAIERYLAGRGDKQAAQRAARVLEAAVGEALGEAEQGRPSEKLPREVTSMSHQDRHRFRKLAQHRDVWMPELERRGGMSRAQVLKMLEGDDESVLDIHDAIIRLRTAINKIAEACGEESRQAIASATRAIADELCEEGGRGGTR